MSVITPTTTSLKPVNPIPGSLFYFTDTNQIGLYQGGGVYYVYNKDGVAYSSGGNEEINYQGGLFSDTSLQYGLSTAPLVHIDASRLAGSDLTPFADGYTQMQGSGPIYNIVNRADPTTSYRTPSTASYAQAITINRYGDLQSIQFKTTYDFQAMSYGDAYTKVANPNTYGQTFASSSVSGGTSVMIFKKMLPANTAYQYQYYGPCSNVNNPFGKINLNDWQSSAPFNIPGVINSGGTWTNGVAERDRPYTHMNTANGDTLDNEYWQTISTTDINISIARQGTSTTGNGSWMLNDVHFQGTGTGSAFTFNKMNGGSSGESPKIFEILFFDSDLSNTDINKIIDYSANKYSTTANHWT
jgi:hypothetical protein